MEDGGDNNNIVIIIIINSTICFIRHEKNHSWKSCRGRFCVTHRYPSNYGLVEFLIPLVGQENAAVNRKVWPSAPSRGVDSHARVPHHDAAQTIQMVGGAGLHFSDSDGICTSCSVRIVSRNMGTISKMDGC